MSQATIVYQGGLNQKINNPNTGELEDVKNAYPVANGYKVTGGVSNPWFRAGDIIYQLTSQFMAGASVLAMQAGFEMDEEFYVIGGRSGGSPSVYKLDTQAGTATALIEYYRVQFSAGTRYKRLDYIQLTGFPSVGNTVTGVTSGAIATVVSYSISGGSNPYVGYLTIKDISGTFIDGESLTVGSYTAEASGEPKEIFDGLYVDSTVTGQTSSNTATVVYKGNVSGSWDNGTAKGWMYLDSDGFTVGEDIVIDGYGMAVIDSVQFQTGGLSVDGNYEFRTTVDVNNKSLTIGVNGIDSAFFIDSNGYGFIETGMGDIVPNALEIHKNRLFLLYSNSLQASGVGNYIDWNDGIQYEFNIMDDGVGLKRLPGDVLGIFGHNKTSILYGDSSANFELVEHSISVGVYAHTIQQINNDVLFLGEGGLSTISATNQYGDFGFSPISDNIDPLISSIISNVYDAARGVSTSTLYSAVNKTDSTYWFFVRSNTTADSKLVVFSFDGGKYRGAGVCHIPGVVSNIFQAKIKGKNRLFGVTSDGYLKEIGGGQVSWYLRFPKADFNAPDIRKKYKRMLIEGDPSPSYNPISVTQTLAHDENNEISMTVCSNQYIDSSGRLSVHLGGNSSQTGLILSGTINVDGGLLLLKRHTVVYDSLRQERG